MKKTIYQKTWFRNMVIIAIPVVISIIGLVISILGQDNVKKLLLVISLVIFVSMILFLIYYSRLDENEEAEKKNIIENNRMLIAISKILERQNIANMYEINTFSQFAETWAKNINMFANDVKTTGTALERYWDKSRLYDLICEKCRDMIEEYVDNKDHTKISVGYIEHTQDEEGNNYVTFLSHSNPSSTRPRAFEQKELLNDCNYHYAKLIREKNPEIEVACNNEEILRIFNRTSVSTDLSKYTQYIAIPVFCSREKVMGIFQIVTKYDYIISDDAVTLKSFAENYLVPYANFLLLIEKIGKGLYAKPAERIGLDGKNKN